MSIYQSLEFHTFLQKPLLQLLLQVLDVYKRQLQVSVQISNDVITGITVISHNDTQGICDRAIEEMPGKIISSQSTSVDVVSGASYTSKGIINAVNDALSKA